MPEPPYTAVVFFHGMGSQRRYGDMSDLVSRLDSWAKDEQGRSPLAIRPRLRSTWGGPDRAADRREPQRGEVFIEVELPDAPPGADPPPRFRFYEAYWAPITAGGAPMQDVLLWLIGQVRNPWRGLLAPWRQRPRYRVAVLYDLWERSPARPRDLPTTEPRHLRLLLDAYAAFGAPAARDGSYPEGTFRQLRSFIRRSPTVPDADKAHCLSLADAWFRAYHQAELRAEGTLISLLLLFLTALLLLIAAAIGLITLIPGALASPSALPGSLLALVTIALTLLGGRAFLEDYMGDVMIWATYEETNQRFAQREAIMEIGRRTLRRVVEDPACQRVVVVAHSLGSSVAYEALLDLGRYNRAAHDLDAPPDRAAALCEPLRLDKLSHLITYGSPIDKILYFFQNERGAQYHYQRLIELIRQDITGLPFAGPAGPNLRWVNFWDERDLISGALQTPLPLRPAADDQLPGLDRQGIVNVQVQNPGALLGDRHGRYLETDSVVQAIYAAIFGGLPPGRIGRPIRSLTLQDLATRRSHQLLLAAIWLAPLLLGMIGLIGALYLPSQPAAADLATQTSWVTDLIGAIPAPLPLPALGWDYCLQRATQAAPVQLGHVGGCIGSAPLAWQVLSSAPLLLAVAAATLALFALFVSNRLWQEKL